MLRYDPKTIEIKWQKKWLKEKIYEPAFAPAAAKAVAGKKASAGKPDFKRARKPFYNLMMFPYPSAEGLHIGSVRTFTGVDIYGRFKRMQGHDVFEPIGLDGFGIHSENYALKISQHPMETAKETEKNYYRQLGEIGNGFAWDERLETYDPEYYRWTQWIFVQMFKRGLAYRKKQAVNWCPSCKTVLADEQVVTGACERCGTMVVKKELEQWFFRITKYAERLLKNLDKLDWPEPIKIAQRNWIGRSEGALIDFSIQDTRYKIQVFTTRPDTLFGATYLVLSPEHEFVKSHESRITNHEEVRQYIQRASKKTEAERIAEGKEKTGVELKGIKVINPANGEEIPIWVADYVLGNVGTGAIMAVPAHDERDFEFAKKFGLEVRIVIEPETGERKPDEQFRKSIAAIVENPKTKKFLIINWGQKLGGHLFIGGGIDGDETPEETALREIREETGYTNVRLISSSERMHHHYFAFSKGIQRYVEVTGLHFELLDESRVDRDLQQDEKGNFVVTWLDRGDVLRKVEDEVHLVAFRRLVLGEVYTGKGRLIHSDKFNGMDSKKAKWEITKFVGGKRVAQYRLRDWLISRQRYWGPPLPMIFCEVCGKSGRGEQKEMPGWYTVSEKDLPIKLPYIKEFRPTGTGKSPLATVEKFYKVRCPKCKSWARRETDVSDTFLDSAWYYIGYLAKNRDSKFIPLKAGLNSIFRSRAKRWLPVHMYIGGAEHAVLHLLYSRFMSMALHDMGVLHFSAGGGSAPGGEEPFTKFRTNGLITKDGAKMSKSRGNVVSPDEYIAAYGADAVRMYLAFMAPLGEGGDFRDTGIKGITRFLERTWRFVQEKSKVIPLEAGQKLSVHKSSHKTIKKVTEDIENLQYNTAISALMMLLNEFEERPNDVSRQDVEIFLKLLAPFAPHIAEELWQQCLQRAAAIRNTRYEIRDTNFRSIHLQPWPKYNPRLLKEDTFELVIQINGKVRDKIEVPVGISKEEAEGLTFGRERVKEIIGDKKPGRIIFVPGRLINIVI